MDDLNRDVKGVMRDVIAFVEVTSNLKLRRYQKSVARAVIDSVVNDRGLTIVVMFPRQSGKNELQAQIEAYLLALYIYKTKDLVKVSPTWKPQSLNAMRRLERVMGGNAICCERWSKEDGYVYRMGGARIFFLSGAPTSNVVGATANLLLQCDEAQDVPISKWDKDFAPMAAATNATRVLWGTAWTSRTLLARELKAAREAEQKDGIRRVFTLTADEVAEEVPEYKKFVADQVTRFGRNHPLVKTQYFCEEIDAEGGMFPPERRRLMQGDHERMVGPRTGEWGVEGIKAEAYIFAPLANPLQQEANGRAEDWDETKCLGSAQVRAILKRYGRLAGIPDEKLTLPALRHTAAMLRLEAGASPLEMQAFLDCSLLKVSKIYLAALPPAGEGGEGLRDLEKDPPKLPDRENCVFKPWERMTHGMWAKSQPPEAVAAVLMENICGIDDELMGLRMICRQLLAMQERATDRVAVTLLGDAYTLASTRLLEMRNAEAQLIKSHGESNWAEKLLEKVARWSAGDGGAESYIKREKAKALGRGDGLAVSARRLAEEIAGARVVLRRTFQMLTDCEEAREWARLAGVYGSGCNRLVRLLRAEGDDQTKLKVYMNEVIDRSIMEIYEEWGLK